MDIENLRRKLELAKISSSYYSLCDRGPKEQRVCLTCENGKWAVFYSERGQKFDYTEFDNEQEACEEVYKRLMEN